MATPPLSPDKVEIGWISAVEVEYIIACELLDEEYTSIASGHHVFTPGKIAGHYVVIGCMPKGEYGVASAGVLAMDMLNTFPKIRFGLMVGIGGGAPTSKRDIRLGDLVISNPDGQSGGVVSYESGKVIQGGEFVRTASLNAPPRLLRSAAQVITQRHVRRGNDINKMVESVLNNTRLKKRYQRPDLNLDVLFESSSVHSDKHQSCNDLKCAETGKRVNRLLREDREDDPMIHYGLIASADKLMKDAIRRDQVAEQEGVLCFEMEAAGLMNTFPCIVIRGICDYSDTHKNDIWQGYAAAIAAVYAKQLLAIIPSAEISREATAADKMASQQQESNILGPSHIVNNYSGTFTSQGRMIVGSTFDSRGGDMHF